MEKEKITGDEFRALFKTANISEETLNASEETL